MAADPCLRTVGCRLKTLIPDAEVIRDIQVAVQRVHEATVYATMLLNLHVRRCIRDGITLQEILNGNWIIKAYQEVTYSSEETIGDVELSITRRNLMPEIDRPNRTGLTQLMQANANTLETLAHNNIWMHFHKRVHSHVQLRLGLTEALYSALSSEERKVRKLQLIRVTHDLLRNPMEAPTSNSSFHAWVQSERLRLQIDDAVGEWNDKPLLYHLKMKKKAHRFLIPMSIMAGDREAAGHHIFALFPLRRSMVPKHVRFDKKSLNAVLQGLRNERLGRKRKAPGDEEFTFTSVMNYRCVRTTRPWKIKDGFTTDGVCARVQQERVERLPKQRPQLNSLPRRGIWAIDELKRVSRLDELHVIGIDPGKKELVVAVDQDNGDRARPVRYTQRERQKDMRSRQYADQGLRNKPCLVRFAEEDLANTNSYSPAVDTFRRYVCQRQQDIKECFAFYANQGHRCRRWKSYLKSQQSEEKLYKKLRNMHKKQDRRTLILAYGSWGLVAGRAGNAANKGNPPCIGKGLMHKLGRR